VGIQGGNALTASAEDLDLLGEGDVVRITLVHLTSSRIGSTSAPGVSLRRGGGLTAFGRDFVRRCNERRILVDLAHAGPATFADAVAVHRADVPLAVTHTGVDGAFPHWRNLTDDQIRAVAATGGCVGVMLHEPFLGPGAVDVAVVADHLEHIVAVGGEDTPAIGTDYDGAVVPPADLPGYDAFPRLVAELHRRGWSDELLGRTLAGNALRTLEAVRG